jgi:DNA-binding GntR family transcriptional regulator
MTLPSSLNSPLRRPVRQVLTDGIYESVKQQLMDLTIPPGTLINMAQLARELDVSTTPLREALARLEAEGLLLLKPLQGYRSAPVLDAKGVDDLFQVRIALEPLAASTAASITTPAELKLLEGSILEMKRITDEIPLNGEYIRYRDFFDEDTRFHSLVAQAAGNPLLARTIEGLHAHVHLYRFYFSGGIGPHTALEHTLIYSALADGDPEAAAGAMQGHLRKSWQRLLASSTGW